MKCAYLENFSMITIIESNCLDLGKPSLKSMLIVCQVVRGMGSGCNSPRVLICSTFSLRHTSQLHL
jgi:hypothetical protein